VSLTAAPSWVQTTLTWLENYRPGHVFGLRGKTAAEKLAGALKRMKFRYVELVTCSEQPRRDAETLWEAELLRMAGVWDEECHRQMKEFLDEGGYEAEAEKVVTPTKKAPPAPKAPKRADPAPAVPDDELEKVERELRPRSEHTPEQELEEAVRVERLARDPALGAW
jgi:hypothetical protein